MTVCECVCVCKREREREPDRQKEILGTLTDRIAVFIYLLLEQ